jgi:acetyl-CoA carboxylase carboxyltransferase component
MAGNDWVALAYEGMRVRQAQRAKEAEERGERVLEEEAKEQTREEKEAAAKLARKQSELERAEQIAASVQEGARLRARAARPMTDYEKRMVGQALPAGWDHWDGPDAA